MADKNTLLGESLGIVGSIKASMKSYKGDGISANTHAALRSAGVDGADLSSHAKDLKELQTRQTMAATPKDATIVMPDGRRITPLQYQKLQQMLNKR